jgi:hypothetical protein
MISDEEAAKLQVEAWKTTIQVQQHFNDIEWKIRGLALTLLTAVLGAAVFAVKEKSSLKLGIVELNLSAVILIFGLIVWMAFYFVDKIWYHRLLIGSVRFAEKLEANLTNMMTDVGLTRTISEASPYQFKLLGKSLGKPIHSDRKLSAFYFIIALVLVLLIFGAQFGTSTASQTHTSPGSTTTSTTLGAAPRPSPFRGPPAYGFRGGRPPR